MYLARIRTGAVIKLAGNASGQLADIGSGEIRSVSDLEEMAAALEGIAQQIEEAVAGLKQNAARSESTPIKDEVLRKLDPAEEGAQQIVTAVTAFLAAFHDEYGPDIAKARAGEMWDKERMQR